MTRVTIENLALTLPAVELTRRAASSQVDTAPPFDEHLRRAGEQAKPPERSESQHAPPRSESKPVEQDRKPNAEPRDEAVASTKQNDSDARQEADSGEEEETADSQLAATTVIVAAATPTERVEISEVTDVDMVGMEPTQEASEQPAAAARPRSASTAPPIEARQRPTDVESEAIKSSQLAERKVPQQVDTAEQVAEPTEQAERGTEHDKTEIVEKLKSDLPESSETRGGERTVRARRTDSGASAKTSDAQGGTTATNNSAAAAKPGSNTAPAEGVASPVAATKTDSGTNVAVASAEVVTSSEVVVGAATGEASAPAGGAVKGADTSIREGSKGAAPRAERAESSGPVDRTRFIQRVSRAFHAIGDDGGQLRLRLSPPELGSLRLEVTLRDGVLTAKLEAETAAARTVLVESLPQLRERLAEQGIQIERFDVDLMNQGSTGSREQFAGEDRAEQRYAGSANAKSKTSTSETSSEPGRSGRVSGASELDVVI